jgi:2-polyprenyl-3-methyl-5-hydroxy-6-metoxy-1,4-benzoquinol methylase
MEDMLNQSVNRTGMDKYDSANCEQLYDIYCREYLSLYGRQRIRSTIKLLENINLHNLDILDIGPGAGLWAAYLSKTGSACRISLLDIKKKLLETAFKTIAIYGSGPPANVYQGFADSFQLPANSFDLVFAKDVIEHIADDRKFVQNIYNMLKPGGILLLTTQNNFSLNYLLEGTYHKRIKRELNYCGWDKTHLRFYNIWKLRKLLAANGLEPFYYMGSYHFPYRLFFRGWFMKLYTNNLENNGFPISKNCMEKISLIQKVIAFPEYLGINHLWPFSITGWSIGILAQKLT